ncbi:MAG: nucleotidyltransferase domain-containing protein [Anaerocolumna sp.]
MKYNDYEGSIESLVQMKLKEIEEKENVKVLQAVESGSRAWGFTMGLQTKIITSIWLKTW